MEWSYAVENLAENYVNFKLLRDESILNNTVKIDINRFLGDVLPPRFTVKITFDRISGEKIEHMYTEYRVDFGPVAKTPDNARLVKIFENGIEVPNPFDDGPNSEFDKFLQNSNGHQKYLVSHKGIDFNVEYDITHGNEIVKISRDNDANSVIFTLNTNTEGIIFVSIPHALGDYGYVRGCYDPEFVIVLNGKELYPFEQKTRHDARIYKIPFDDDLDELEVISSHVPESRQHHSNCVREMQPYMNPKEQFANGVLPNDIFCRDNLWPIIKISNDSPVCVKPSSVQKLIERGWAKSE